jgi:hypothetical protein
MAAVSVYSRKRLIAPSAHGVDLDPAGIPRAARGAHAEMLVAHHDHGVAVLDHAVDGELQRLDRARKASKKRPTSS